MGRKQRTTKGPSLRQIAERMKVNVSTVSRALGGDPGVGPERAARIRSIAEQLGYRPQPMRRKRTGNVGLLVSTDSPGRPDDHFQQRVMILVADEATKRNLHLHVEFVPRHAPFRSLPAVIQDNRVDGVLLSGHPSAGTCERIRKLGMPAVVIHDSLQRTRLDCVTVGVGDAMREAIARLVEAGRDDLAFTASDTRYPTVAARIEAFKAAAKEQGLGTKSVRVMEGFGNGIEGGREAVARVVAAKRVPKAMLFINDVSAIGAMYELCRRGLKVPDDIGVLGYDDTPMAAEMEPALSSFDQGERAGMSAALDVLVDRIGGASGEVKEVVLPVRLVWRDSCG